MKFTGTCTEEADIFAWSFRAISLLKTGTTPFSSTVLVGAEGNSMVQCQVTEILKYVQNGAWVTW
jgi:hypothetical protein